MGNLPKNKAHSLRAYATNTTARKPGGTTAMLKARLEVILLHPW